MKVCRTCGTRLDDSVAFCPNCGNNLPAKQPVYREKAKKEPISVGGWIGRMLIPYIPLVGSIVYLIMLFIWSGDTKKEKTFRNWAKAQLILVVVNIVLACIGVVLFGSFFADLLNSL